MNAAGQSVEDASRTGLHWFAYVVAAGAFVVLIALGTWQVERLHWKEALLQTIELRRHAAPLPLAEVEQRFATTQDVDYQSVSAEGHFLNALEQHFFATWKGDAGFYVYTPFQLDDGRTVFVNRGFVPYDLKSPDRRSQGQVEGRVAVTGLARNPLQAKPSMMVPDNDLAKNIYYWKDLAAMSAQAKLESGKVLPFFIDADATPNPGGLPEGGVTLIDLPNSHLQYALTWYGLAGALVVVFGAFAWRNRKRSG